MLTPTQLNSIEETLKYLPEGINGIPTYYEDGFEIAINGNRTYLNSYNEFPLFINTLKMALNLAKEMK